MASVESQCLSPQEEVVWGGEERETPEGPESRGLGRGAVFSKALMVSVKCLC